MSNLTVQSYVRIILPSKYNMHKHADNILLQGTTHRMTSRISKLAHDFQICTNKKSAYTFIEWCLSLHLRVCCHAIKCYSIHNRLCN